jgi:hypothetical protein
VRRGCGKHLPTSPRFHRLCKPKKQHCPILMSRVVPCQVDQVGLPRASTLRQARRPAAEPVEAIEPEVISTRQHLLDKVVGVANQYTTSKNKVMHSHGKDEEFRRYLDEFRIAFRQKRNFMKLLNTKKWAWSRGYPVTHETPSLFFPHRIMRGEDSPYASPSAEPKTPPMARPASPSIPSISSRV